MVLRQQGLIATGILVAVWLFTAAAHGERYVSPETIVGTHKIDAEQLIALVDRHPDLTIIDSRIVSDRKLGHIPGSISLPDTDTSCESLAQIIAGQSSPVVFYCNGPRCRRSDNAVVIAVNCGYSKVYWFRGGIEDWSKANYPVDK